MKEAIMERNAPRRILVKIPRTVNFLADLVNEIKSPEPFLALSSILLTSKKYLTKSQTPMNRNRNPTINKVLSIVRGIFLFMKKWERIVKIIPMSMTEFLSPIKPTVGIRLNIIGRNQ